jgi:hypothetical protein
VVSTGAGGGVDHTRRDRGGRQPFAPGRRAADLVTALPAIGMLLGAVLGAVLGRLNPDGTAVGFAGVGIVAGLVLGAVLRTAFRRG